MAETTISCSYRRLNKATAICVSCLWVLTWLSALAVWHQVWVAYSLALNPILKLLGLIVMLLAGGVGFVWLPFSLHTAYVDGNLLSANSEGLTLPVGMLGRPMLLRWTEVAVVEYAENSGTLMLITREGKAIKVALAGLGEAAEKFMVALEVWATAAQWSASASVKRDDLQNGKLEATSFTRIWDNELNRRFSSTSFVPLEPGAKLDNNRYRVLRQLAFGGFCAVYLAQDQDGNKVVLKEALFTNRPQEIVSEKERELFRREAIILRQLEHERIARILDQFVDNQRNYLVIEYVEGETLRDLVRRGGTVDEARVRRWALEMAEILEYLHNHSPVILHRDFTPDNLILNKEGKICLIDFGSANEFIEQATGTFIGKQCYMPPEQVQGKASPASDFYALGCTLFFLLTGIDPKPLAQSSPRSVDSAIADDLDRLVIRLTAMDPADRPVCARDMSAESAFLRDLKISLGAERKLEAEHQVK